MRFQNKSLIAVFFLLFLFPVCDGQETSVPFKVDPLFHFENPATLGLQFIEGLETITIFLPTDGDNKYNHGVVLFPFTH